MEAEREEWHGRYLEHLVEKGLSCCEAYDTLMAGMGEYDYESSAEDAADDELSYWINDA